MEIKRLFCFVALFCFMGCNTVDHENKKGVLVFTVDYTTNKFLGGYDVLLSQSVETIQMEYEYNMAGDFGDVTWFEKTTGTKLFSGTIVWMGTGKQTFPEEVSPSSSFEKLSEPAAMPSFTPLSHSPNNAETIDYEKIWEPIKYLQKASWVTSETKGYVYLYMPSVGEGNPANWYWVVFLEN